MFNFALARLTDMAGDKLGTLFLAITVIVTFYKVFSVIRQWHRLRHIPGPFINGFSKLPLLAWEFKEKVNLEGYEFHKKHGSVARVSPDMILTSDPELVKRALNVRSNYTRSDWYGVMRFDPGKDNVISQRDDALHNKLRAKMAAGYSGRKVDALEPRVDKNIQELMRLLDTKYISQGKAFDFARKVQYFTLDIISDLAYGKPFGYLKEDKDLWDFIGTLESQMRGVMMAAIYPWIVDLLTSPVLGLTPTSKDVYGFGKILGMVDDIVEERYGPKNKIHSGDILSSFAAHGMTGKEAKSEIMVQIMAGSDTTATAIRATLLHVVTNPVVLRSLRSEMASAGLTIEPLDHTTPIISNNHARTLPYLQAVIKEGLRIHPPVSSLSVKEVPKTGDTFKGMYFPPGTKLGISMWALTRHQDLFGEDADEFRPERWIEAKQAADQEEKRGHSNEARARLKEMEFSVDLVFGHGKWGCLGKNIALMELNKVFVELLRRYDFVVLNPMKPWDSKYSGVFSQKDFWLKAYKWEEASV